MKIELNDEDIRKMLAEKFGCNTREIEFEITPEYDDISHTTVDRVTARIEKE